MCQSSKGHHIIMLYHYNVAVHPDVAAEVRVEDFAQEAGHILDLPRGWRQWGFRFVRVYPDNAGAAQMRARRGFFFTLQLTPNAEIRKFGEKEFDGMSVCDCGHHMVYINADRWRGGAKPTTTDSVRHMPLASYRQYVILHEVGHILSQCSPTHHKKACAPCGRAPVMMQQTNGVGACRWNPWPLRGVDDTEPLAVAAAQQRQRRRLEDG